MNRKIIAYLFLILFTSPAHAAIDFETTSSQYCNTVTAPVTEVPFTISCWFQSDQNTALDTLVQIQDTATANNYWRLRIDGDNATKTVSAGVRAGGVESVALTSITYTVGKWHHICGVFTSATSRDAFLDGRGKGSNTTSLTPAGIDIMSIGMSRDSTPSNAMNGRISDLAIWNVALTDQQVAQLASNAKGMPLQVRPDALVAYYPMNEYAQDVRLGTSSYLRDDSRNDFRCTTVASPFGVADGALSYP